MNKVMLSGRLTKDVELKTTQSGLSFARFTLAVDRRVRDADGGRQADFVSIVAWRKTAEVAAKYLSKGRQCIVEGSIQTGSYEKNGQKIYTTDVLADSIEFIGARNDNADPAPAPDVSHGEFTEIDDNDLPF